MPDAKLTPARYLGKPCVRCGSMVRWKCDWKCVHCKEARAWARRKRRLQSDPHYREHEREIARRTYERSCSNPLWYQSMLMRHASTKRKGHLAFAHARLDAERDVDDTLTQSILNAVLKGDTDGSLPPQG